jgi:flagellar basal-body rod modification protein FlgD
MNLNSIVQQVEATQQQQAAAKAKTMNANTAQSAASSATNGSSTSNSTTNSATITANDFLTLLVSELQNQDPTANTDPNQYVNQLVNVNSLQQLISINQEVGSLSPSTPSSSGSNPSAGVHAAGATANSSSAQPTPAKTSTASALASYAAALQPGTPSALVAGHASNTPQSIPQAAATQQVPTSWWPGAGSTQ